MHSAPWMKVGNSQNTERAWSRVCHQCPGGIQGQGGGGGMREQSPQSAEELKQFSETNNDFHNEGFVGEFLE